MAGAVVLVAAAPAAVGVWHVLVAVVTVAVYVVASAAAVALGYVLVRAGMRLWRLAQYFRAADVPARPERVAVEVHRAELAAPPRAIEAPARARDGVIINGKEAGQVICNSNSFTMDERIVATFPLIIRMVCQSERARG